MERLLVNRPDVPGPETGPNECLFEIPVPLRIHAEPVLFQRRPEKKSTVKLFRDSIRSFFALLKFRKDRVRRRA